MIIPIFSRVLGDCTKTVLQGLGYIKPVGILSALNLTVFLGYSYYFVSILKLGLEGYVYSMIIYESLNAISSFLFFILVTDKLYKDISIPVFENFCWFFYESFKTTSSSFYSWASFEFILIIVTLTKDNSQIAAFSILNSIPTIFGFLVSAFTVNPRNKLNGLLSSGKL